VIAGQTFYNFTLENLKHFAALKAMGATNGKLLVMVVTGVSLLVHVYSIGYMHGDPGYPRFFASLNLFSASIR